MVSLQDLLPITPDGGINVTSTLVTILLALVTYVVVSTRRPHGLPPGPPSVPLFGSIPFLKHGGAEYYKEFSSLAKKYGDIFSFALGHTWVVVLNNYDIIREALVTKGVEFAGRFDEPRADMFRKVPGQAGIVDGDYTPEWANQRSTSLHIMRNFGWGKQSIELKMAEEREVLLNILKESDGKPINPAPIINTSVTNIICSMLFGNRFEHSDERFKGVLKNLNSIIQMFAMDFEWDYVPYLSRFIPAASYYENLMRESVKGIHGFIEPEIELRAQRLEEHPDEEPQDFLGSYLREFKTAGKEKKSKITEDWLLEISTDFFSAGSETTTTTLKWAINYMVNFPEVQRKVQEELTREMGPPSGCGATILADRKKLPYTEATIMEIQRMAAIVATALVHCTIKDVNIRGYHLPKGTQVRYNTYAVMHDPTYWDEPEKLKPERFIDEEGEVRKDERWIPFGMGRRNCLGEQLARQELFMFFSGILHNFNIRMAEGAKPPSLSPAHFGVILMPAPYEVVFEPRF